MMGGKPGQQRDLEADFEIALARIRKAVLHLIHADEIHSYRAHEVLTAGGSQGKLVSERRRPGSARSAFQAAQAASTTASWPPASTRWLSQRSRRYSHTRSTGFNSGLYGGGWIRVRFAGTVRSSLTCQPAPSSTSAAWVPAGTARASSARNTPIAAVETSGRTSATPSPRSGQTAPNR